MVAWTSSANLPMRACEVKWGGLRCTDGSIGVSFQCDFLPFQSRPRWKYVHVVTWTRFLTNHACPAFLLLPHARVTSMMLHQVLTMALPTPPLVAFLYMHLVLWLVGAVEVLSNGGGVLDGTEFLAPSPPSSWWSTMAHGSNQEWLGVKDHLYFVVCSSQPSSQPRRALPTRHRTCDDVVHARACGRVDGRGGARARGQPNRRMCVWKDAKPTLAFGRNDPQERGERS